MAIAPTGALPLREREPAKPLRVAHLTGEAGFSGGEVQLFHLIEGLRKRQHECVLLGPTGSRAEAEALRRGLDFRPVRARNEWSPRCFASVRDAFARVAPDVVHLHSGHATWLGGLAAWSLGFPALTTRRMDRPVKRNLRTRILYGACVQRAVAISPAVARQLVQGGVPEAMIEVVPSAVDPAALVPQRSRAATRRRLGTSESRICVLTAATLVKRKGVDTLLEAIAQLVSRGHDPELWIAGAGPEQKRLTRLAQRLGLGERARFLGARSDVPELLAACDVFALASRHEGLGVAVLEALALAKPIVATRAGGLCDALRHERTGLLVPTEDPIALADALERLLRDRELAESMARRGPVEIADAFSTERMVEAYERIYRAVLAEAWP
jgi:glycosyltransferase involved in cell wall biosynthesis